MVECIHFHPELRYTQAELEQYLPQISEEPAAPAGPAAKGTQQGLSGLETLRLHPALPGQWGHPPGT